VFRLIVDTPVSLKLAGYENGYTYGGFLWIVNNIYFQYYSVLITVISIIVLVVVSYATAPPLEEKLTGLTYATITPEQRRQSRESWSTIELVGSAVVVGAIVAAYLYFNG
jgi:SSS family solute:Na+ symporter